MNFDELQKQWKLQPIGKLTINEESLKKTNSILNKIKRNFKNESIAGFISLISLIIVPYVSENKIEGINALFYYFFLSQIALSTIFNFRRFYYIHKSSVEYQILTSREGLLKRYYELKFTVETYRLLCYLSIPAAIGLFMILVSQGNFMLWLDRYTHFEATYTANPFFIWKSLLFIFGLIFLIIFFCEIWINFLYGKPLNQLKRALDELEEK